MAWLTDRAEVLHELGVVDFVREIASTAWVRNINDRHDEVLGDTARSLGVTQSENVRVLAVRKYRDDRECWAARGVEVSDPQQSLLITAAGLSIHPTKAPVNRQQEPSWTGWRWSDDSNVRLDAARVNRASYKPNLSGGRQQTLGLEQKFLGDPSALAHLAMVYVGDQQTGRTAGWVAVPSAEKEGQETRERWMAAVRLWWDESAADGQSVRPDSTTPTSSDAFDARPLPTPTVSIRPARRKPAQ